MKLPDFLETPDFLEKRARSPAASFPCRCVNTSSGWQRGEAANAPPIKKKGLAHDLTAGGDQQSQSNPDSISGWESVK